MTDTIKTLGEARAIWNRNGMPTPKGEDWMDAMFNGAMSLLALEQKHEAEIAAAFESAAKAIEQKAAWCAQRSEETISEGDIYDYGESLCGELANIVRALAGKPVGAEQGNGELLDACEFALESLTLEKDSYLGDGRSDVSLGVIYDELPYSNIKLAVARAKGCKVTGPIDGVYTVEPPTRDAVARQVGEEMKNDATKD